MNTMYKSFQNLAKYNNGMFKSEKQSEFLTQYAENRNGCIGHLIANGNPVFVELDNLGILKMYYRSSTKKGYSNFAIFERAVKGELNDMQLKEIKRLESRLKKFEKRLADYISIGHISGCSYEATIEGIENHKKAIEIIKNESNN